jgi:hypothetical protein
VGCSHTNFANNLIAIEKIQKSFQPQQSLMGQTASIVGEGRIAKLVRQIDSPQAKASNPVPQGWGNDLFETKRYEQMIGAIENESIVAIKFLQNPALFDLLLVGYESPLRFIPGISYLAHPSMRLAAVDRYQEFTKGITYWRNQNICRTDGKSGLKSTSGFDEYLVSTMNAVNQYSKVLKRDLLWELTTSVRQVKARLAAGEKIDLVTKEFNLRSQVCSGENWSAIANDGAITISLSHPPNWKDLESTFLTDSHPMTYKINLVDRN